MTHTVCFHCGEPVTTGMQFSTVIDGQAQPMCCLGCQAVAQAIMDAGLTNYYKFRSEPGSRQNALVPDELKTFSAYDLPEVQQDFVHDQVIKPRSRYRLTALPVPPAPGSSSTKSSSCPA